MRTIARLLSLTALLFIAACASPHAPTITANAPAPVLRQGPAQWVQYTADGLEARFVAKSDACPDITIDGKAQPMALRAASDAAFPRLCAAQIPSAAKSASIRDVPLALPVASPTRILVLGDTGCRIKGSAVQACNDPKAWPFAGLAAAAARLKPDLVVHLGDYLYRESPCPAGNAGCAGSPWGDNWASWEADFFSPGAPLLAAAPWIVIRGNHEDCFRAGPGYLRLLGPGVFDAGAKCANHVPSYTVPLGPVSIVVMDDANAPDTSIDAPFVPVYAAELAGLAKAGPPPVWLALHRPIWGLISGPLGVPIGGNKTLIAAAGKTLIPKPVELMLAGHIHTFEAINYDSGLPPQIVAGNGGDNLDPTPRNLKGAIFQGDSGVHVKDGLSVPGFGFLMMTKAGDSWDIQLYDSAGRPERQCRFHHGRVDCAKENS